MLKFIKLNCDFIYFISREISASVKLENTVENILFNLVKLVKY